MLFCSPGDKETKPCAGEGGRIRASGVHQGTSCAAAFTTSAFSWWEGAGSLFIAAVDRNLPAGHVHKCCHPPQEGFFRFSCSLPARRITCIHCTSVPRGARAAVWSRCRRHCLPASFWSEMISVYVLLCTCTLREKKKNSDSYFFWTCTSSRICFVRGRMGEAVVSHIALIEPMLQNWYLEFGKTCLFSTGFLRAFGNAQLCPCSVWMKSGGAASAVLLPVINQVSFFTANTDLASKPEAVEMILAAEVGSCYPMRSSSCAVLLLPSSLIHWGKL